jgi:hypothetical protein
VVGYKLVRLYAPSDSDKMYRVAPGASGSSSSAEPGRAAPAGAVSGGGDGGAGPKGGAKKVPAGKGGKKDASAAAVDATLSQGNVSAVDVEHPDLGAHPAFAGAHHYDVLLGPGDGLFIPKGWWHYVRALTPSWSLNFWW